MNTDLTARILSEIQRSIRQKDEEMSWADASCLQFVIRGRGSKDKPESYTFQCRDPNVKKEWIVGKYFAVWGSSWKGNMVALYGSDRSF